MSIRKESHRFLVRPRAHFRQILKHCSEYRAVFEVTTTNFSSLGTPQYLWSNDTIFALQAFLNLKRSFIQWSRRSHDHIAISVSYFWFQVHYRWDCKRRRQTERSKYGVKGLMRSFRDLSPTKSPRLPLQIPLVGTIHLEWPSLHRQH